MNKSAPTIEMNCHRLFVLINWGVIDRLSAFHVCSPGPASSSLGDQLVFVMLVVPVLHVKQSQSTGTSSCGTKGRGWIGLQHRHRLLSNISTVVGWFQFFFNLAPVGAILQINPTSTPHATQIDLLNRKVTRVPRSR
jgi:hypothetical protein